MEPLPRSSTPAQSEEHNTAHQFQHVRISSGQTWVNHKHVHETPTLGCWFMPKWEGSDEEYHRDEPRRLLNCVLGDPMIRPRDSNRSPEDSLRGARENICPAQEPRNFQDQIYRRNQAAIRRLERLHAMEADFQRHEGAFLENTVSELRTRIKRRRRIQSPHRTRVRRLRNQLEGLAVREVLTPLSSSAGTSSGLVREEPLPEDQESHDDQNVSLSMFPSLDSLHPHDSPPFPSPSRPMPNCDEQPSTSAAASQSRLIGHQVGSEKLTPVPTMLEVRSRSRQILRLRPPSPFAQENKMRTSQSAVEGSDSDSSSSSSEDCKEDPEEGNNEEDNRSSEESESEGSENEDPESDGDGHADDGADTSSESGSDGENGADIAGDNGHASCEKDKYEDHDDDGDEALYEEARDHEDEPGFEKRGHHLLNPLRFRRLTRNRSLMLHGLASLVIRPKINYSGWQSPFSRMRRPGSDHSSLIFGCDGACDAVGESGDGALPPFHPPTRRLPRQGVVEEPTRVPSPGPSRRQAGGSTRTQRPQRYRQEWQPPNQLSGRQPPDIQPSRPPSRPQSPARYRQTSERRERQSRSPSPVQPLVVTRNRVPTQEPGLPTWQPFDKQGQTSWPQLSPPSSPPPRVQQGQQYSRSRSLAPYNQTQGRWNQQPSSLTLLEQMDGAQSRAPSPQQRTQSLITQAGPPSSLQLSRQSAQQPNSSPDPTRSLQQGRQSTQWDSRRLSSRTPIVAPSRMSSPLPSQVPQIAQPVPVRGRERNQQPNIWQRQEATADEPACKGPPPEPRRSPLWQTTNISDAEIENGFALRSKEQDPERGEPPSVALQPQKLCFGAPVRQHGGSTDLGGRFKQRMTDEECDEIKQEWEENFAKERPPARNRLVDDLEAQRPAQGGNDLEAEVGKGKVTRFIQGTKRVVRQSGRALRTFWLGESY